MNASGHLFVGLGAVTVLEACWPMSGDMLTLTLMLGAGAVGALLPDIDHNASRIRRASGTARGQGLLGWLGGIGAAVLGGHRGLTHTAFALGLLTAVLGTQWPSPYSLAFLVGYASHLVADAFTDAGVPLLWPLVQARLRVRFW